MIIIKTNSITFKLFLLIFVLIVFITGIISAWVINDSNKIVQEEIQVMRLQVLDEISNNISILLSNVESIGNNIVADNKLIDILSNPKDKHQDDTVNKENYDYVEGLLMDQIFKYGKFNMKPELYIVGENGLSYGTYSKNKYNLENIKNQEWYEKIVKANGNTVLINTYRDENGIGPYKNILKMGRVIKDFITNETLGVLIIDISETMLYDRYSDLLEKGTSVYIVDSTENIISSKDKRLIGTKYKSNKNSHNMNSSNIEIKSNIDSYGWKIIQVIPSNIMSQVSNKIAQRTLYIIALISIPALIITYKISVWITNPILKIKDKMEYVMKGNLEVEVEVDRDDEIGQLQSSFNSMVKRLHESIEDIKKYEKQKRVAELSFLQAQINPHFLYNTLSGIRFLVSMNKTEVAEEMLYRFTKLLRSILPRASEMITLEEELENIKNYVELQKMRYPNCFDVEYEFDEKIKDYKIPSFILQPIVENAILYSMEKENNKGYINIKGYSLKDSIRIIIEDNGIGMSKDKLDHVLNKEASINSVGVINVHERIQLNYGQDYGLKIDSLEGKGTKITFILPN
ncbi:MULTISPECIES: cache domain-containing sensor histidine kinase [Peptostreptococcaceae]|uniref:cache domain-containing sensor histidine kinase n=1 Tax=Peptostreptococcaceae TaxID=186804 RepID=UPI001D01F4E9|nr:sensor histidine kinase [Paraclostridium bifermentans]MCE9675113.1 sensor histidine kinase [Paraclostridium bifermentans]MDV8112759.1 sensor histidine kinase [Bacillus sp. BAU-SS-2023]GKZ04366.1 histidine kinase [Paraclostridium bifermentans]GKZ11657.1 histidine kinase [Paraclostridium bifermentans]